MGTDLIAVGMSLGLEEVPVTGKHIPGHYGHQPVVGIFRSGVFVPELVFLRVFDGGPAQRQLAVLVHAARHRGTGHGGGGILHGGRCQRLVAGRDRDIFPVALAAAVIHSGQRVTAGKGLLINEVHRDGNADRGQAAAVVEHTPWDTVEILRQRNGGQAGAACEKRTAGFYQPLGQLDRLQRRAKGAQIGVDVRYIIRNDKGDQAGTPEEHIFSDPHQTVGQGDGGQVAATVEGEVSDIGDPLVHHEPLDLQPQRVAAPRCIVVGRGIGKLIVRHFALAAKSQCPVVGQAPCHVFAAAAAVAGGPRRFHHP